MTVRFFSLRALFLILPAVFLCGQNKSPELKALDVMKGVENWSIEIMHENMTKEVKTLSDGSQEVTVKYHGYSDLELMVLNDVIYTLKSVYGYSFATEAKKGYGRIKIHTFLAANEGSQNSVEYILRLYFFDSEGNLLWVKKLDDIKKAQRVSQISEVMALQINFYMKRMKQ